MMEKTKLSGIWYDKRYVIEDRPDLPYVVIAMCDNEYRYRHPECFTFERAVKLSFEYNQLGFFYPSEWIRLD